MSTIPTGIAAAWEEALAADRPIVVEFKTDPEVPPLPPHITLKQAKAFVELADQGRPGRAQRDLSAPRARCSPRCCPVEASELQLSGLSRMVSVGGELHETACVKAAGCKTDSSSS